MDMNFTEAELDAMRTNAYANYDIQKMIKDETGELSIIPSPTYRLNVGDKVAMIDGTAVVIDVLSDGKMYLLKHWSNKLNAKGEKAEGVEVRPFWEVRPVPQSTKTLLNPNMIRFTTLTTSIDSLLHRYFFAGLSLDPEYQRELVWDLKDKQLLIQSIFNNIDIGKIVLIYTMRPGDVRFEVLDGKQRVSAIIDYYLNKFPCNGLYYNDLSSKDKIWFMSRYSLNLLQAENLSRSEKLMYFIMLNDTGKHMSDEHLNKVKRLYNETLNNKEEK